MTVRRCLSNRRNSLTFDLEVAGLRYKATVGYFDDGAPAESFISNHKSGNAADLAARDAGILISLALQHGCDLTTIARAVSRDSDGSPVGVVGAVLDLITETKGATP